MKNLISLFAFFAICSLTSMASVMYSYQNTEEISVMCWGEGEESFTSAPIGDPNEIYDIDVSLLIGPEYSNEEIQMDFCCYDPGFLVSYADGVGCGYDYIDEYSDVCSVSGEAIFWVDYYSAESDFDPDVMFWADIKIAQ